jgi:hypothetical protein
VRQVLISLDEDAAVVEADRLADNIRHECDIQKLLPPVIDIRSHRDGDKFATTDVTIEYTARSLTNEKIDDVAVYLDDEKIVSRGLVPVNSTGGEITQLQLALPHRNVKITLVGNVRPRHTADVEVVASRHLNVYARRVRGSASSCGATPCPCDARSFTADGAVLGDCKHPGSSFVRLRSLPRAGRPDGPSRSGTCYRASAAEAVDLPPCPDQNAGSDHAEEANFIAIPHSS